MIEKKGFLHQENIFLKTLRLQKTVFNFRDTANGFPKQSTIAFRGTTTTIFTTIADFQFWTMVTLFIPQLKPL